METYFFNLVIIENHRNTEKNICNKRKHFRVTFLSVSENKVTNLFYNYKIISWYFVLQNMLAG